MYRFFVSDYLQDAPKNVIEHIVMTIIALNFEVDIGFTEEADYWLTSFKFSEKHSPLFIERNPGIESEEGVFKSFQEAVDRLV